jgi:hypothetical protein
MRLIFLKTVINEVTMPSPRRIPPVRPSPGTGEEGTAVAKRESDSLGKILLHDKAVSRENLDAALASQRKSFLPIGYILREEYGLTEEALLVALKKQTNSTRLYLRFFPAKREIVTLLDDDFCRQHEIIAFEKLGNVLCVAMANPAQKVVIKQIESMTGLEVKLFNAPWEDIQRKLTPKPD